MNGLRRATRVLWWLTKLLAFNLCGWSVAYFAIWLLFESFGNRPSEYVRFLIANSLAFVLIFGGLMLFGFLNRHRRLEPFELMMDAMKRIAKGDFSVNVTVGKKGGPFGAIAESFNRMAEELKQMEEMRQEFISNVSHEIQSPLTSIRGFARALQHDGLSREERLRYLGIIETECMRLSKLSENLLKLASLESDRHPFEPKRYRLDKQLRSVILACEPQWADKGIDMDVELQEAYVVADEDLMSQVWTNLINNSIKFTPGGGTVAVRLERVGPEWVVQISDTGIGMAEDELARIFQRFYKADKSRNREIGGSGLGLAIVKKIVDMHKGSIRVRSRPGEGSTFSVSLPVAPE